MKFSLLLVVLSSCIFHSFVSPVDWKFWKKKKNPKDVKNESISKELPVEKKSDNQMLIEALQNLNVDDAQQILRSNKDLAGQIGESEIETLIRSGSTAQKNAQALLTLLLDNDVSRLQFALRLGIEYANLSLVDTVLKKASLETSEDDLLLVARHTTQDNLFEMSRILDMLVPKLTKRQSLVDICMDFIGSIQVFLDSYVSMSELGRLGTSFLLIYLESKAYDLVQQDVFDTILNHPNTQMFMPKDGYRMVLENLLNNCRIEDLKTLLKKKKIPLNASEDG